VYSSDWLATRLANRNLARSSGAKEIGVADREDIKVRTACGPKFTPHGESAVSKERERRSAWLWFMPDRWDPANDEACEGARFVRCCTANVFACLKVECSAECVEVNAI
jgi:hypothetical protein